MADKGFRPEFVEGRDMPDEPPRRKRADCEDCGAPFEAHKPPTYPCPPPKPVCTPDMISAGLNLMPYLEGASAWQLSRTVEAIYEAMRALDPEWKRLSAGGEA